MQIDQSNFTSWKNDEVTVEVMKALRSIREEINLTLTDATTLLGPNASTVIPRLIGQREGLDWILEIKCEDIQESEDEGEETLRS